jgi:peptide/nickel transport system permease protein
MARYALRRLAEFVPILFVASILVWLMIYLVPGDPVLLRLGPDATPAQIIAERRAMGLDRPFVVQYVYWLEAAIRGDFGRSVSNGDPVTSLIGRAFPVTLSLTVAGLVIATIIGVLFGTFAALKPRGATTKSLNAYTSLVLAIPTFWIGMLLVWLFAIHLGVLPSSGYIPFSESPTEYVRHLVLPAVTLGLYGSGIVARFVAAAMTETLAQDHLWTARAKGLAESAVIRRHAFRNALIPVTTVLGLQFGLLLGGAVIIEGVFNLPGMGRLLLNSVSRRDYAVVQAEVLFILVAVAFVNIIVDVLYGLLDPRIRVH